MFKNLKIHMIFLAVSFIFIQTACAITLDEGKQAFQKYVKNSNACNMTFINMYDKQSVIKRIVTNKDGSTYTKILPCAMYKTMLISYSQVALIQGYSNVYTNVSFHQTGDDITVKALRHPSTSQDRLPATIVFGKSSTGRIIVKEETFHTNAGFLIK